LGPPPAPEAGQFCRVVREIARGGLAGLITGTLMGGIGGRVAMRISSLIDMQERALRTENGALVGELTLEGTLGLVVFVGIFTGIGMAVIWVVVQRWLPSTGVARYAAAGVVGVAMGGRFAIDGRNFDFRILDPAVGQATIFIVLAGITGAVVVRVDRWLERRLPRPTGMPLLGYSAVSLLGIVIAVPFITLYFNREDCACVSPPRLVGSLLIVVGLLTLFSWLREVRGSGSPGWMSNIAQIAVVSMTLAGLLHLGGEIAHFV